MFLLKSPRPIITNLGTHCTKLRQVRADFEVFDEWNLTVSLLRSHLSPAPRGPPLPPSRGTENIGDSREARWFLVECSYSLPGHSRFLIVPL
jgi:hypothetical protein